jgi:RNA polymerase primary sigma factor
MSCSREMHADVSNSLQVYLREIKDESRLTAQDERNMAEAIARGDRDARSRIIQSNLKLVVNIAREFLGRGLALEDLISEGNLGLIRAAGDFQPRFGTRFSTYASYWIKQSIRHALINTTSTIRLPAHMVGLLTRWRRVEQSLHRQRGSAPSFDDIALVLDLSDNQKMLVAQARQTFRLTPDGIEAVEAGLRRAYQVSNRCEGASATLQDAEDRRILRERMQDLDDRESTILELRYGLNGNEPMTLREIGRRLGITREWVRKIELRAVRKLAKDNEGDRGKGSSGAPALARPARRPRWTQKRAVGQQRRCSTISCPAR